MNGISVPLINGERHIVVVVASYNNADYFQRNLGSIFDQKYSNYHVIYINDCSSDKTLEMAEQYTLQRGMQDKVYFVDNEERQGALYNQYRAIHMCRDTDLIVILDGDDWLFDRYVFSYLNGIYNNEKIWLTYGQFVQHPNRHRGWCVPMPDDIVKNNGFRQYTHAPSHLRTFYAGLFKQIKQQDLMYQGDFFRMTGDAAAMFPMIEMAREGHFQFISKVLLYYNIGNPICDHKTVKGLQQVLDREIRSRKKYDAIKTPFLSTESELFGDDDEAYK